MRSNIDTYLSLMVDIGNSNVVCAVVADNEVVTRFRFESDRNLSVEDYHRQMRRKMHDYPLAGFKYAAIGSVVPGLTETIEKLLKDHSRAKVYKIDGLSEIGLRYLIKDRSVVGPDLVANAFAAWKKYQSSTLVIDLGTATTIQLIDQSGLYAGAIIAPGIRTGASQLFVKAAMLHEIELQTPNQLLGNTTEDALLSGIITGHAMMLRGFISEIKANYSEYAPFKIILTGGLAALIAPMCASDYEVDQNLTIEGLHLAMQVLIDKES